MAEVVISPGRFVNAMNSSPTFYSIQNEYACYVTLIIHFYYFYESILWTRVRNFD